MAYYVYGGAKIKCSCGNMEPKLEVIDPEGVGFICGKSFANVMDCQPLKNIPSFGMCSSLLNPTVSAATAANWGKLQEMPCIMPNIVGKWESFGSIKGYIRGEPVLTDDALLSCAFNLNGIEITENFKDYYSSGAMGLSLIEILFDKEPDRGPGTTYINEYGQLLCRRNDGVAGRILIVLDKNISLLEQRLRKAKMVGNLNDPDNKELLNIGMTGEQYTNKIAPDAMGRRAYKECYEIGYSGTGDQIFARRMALLAAEGLGSGGEVDIVGDYVLFKSNEGLDDGIEDRQNRRIDRFNPTARITGSPLIQI